MEKDTHVMFDCSLTCTTAALHCISTGGEHAAPPHLNLLFDCAAICKLAADFTNRDSPNRGALCRLCANICRQCADECRSLSGDDEMMRMCAETCRRCADTCERLSEQ